MAAIRSWLALFVCAVIPAVAAAQAPDTRAAEIARQQEEKATGLKPYVRNVFERRLAEIEQAGGFAVPRGFFVTFGDIKQGSSIALGPAYGQTFENGSVFIAKGAYSIREFKLAQVFAQAPPLAGGRLTINGRAL